MVTYIEADTQFHLRSHELHGNRRVVDEVRHLPRRSGLRGLQHQLGTGLMLTFCDEIVDTALISDQERKSALVA